ncbi:MAG: HAMP domain-containing histidine kinase [Catenulispora sp.]|nr:HAMP domain-containing histidine kinase [Catenulispora sp.]
MNLRSRVAVSGAGAVVAALAVVGAVMYPAFDAQMRQNIDSQLSSSSADPETDKEFQAVLDDVNGAKVPTIMVPLGSRLLDVLLTPEVGVFDKFAPVTARDVAVGAGKSPPYFEDLRLENVLYRVYVAPIALKGYPGAAVRIAQPESDRTKTLHQFGWLLAALIPAAGLLAALGARLLAARVLSPVARLTSAVEHVTATGDLATPIAVTGRDEVARLGLAFNAMTTTLDGSVGAQRRLVADASHELRTPLTSMMTNLELLAERPDDPQAPRLIDEALRQARELTLLTNDLVDLARYGEAPARDELVYVDQVCAELADRRGVPLDLERERGTQPTPTPFLVRGDPAALERAVTNLVDNALKFGTAARISVRAGLGTVVVEVQDDGPGIPAADLPYIFDRFHRAEAARALPGSGLGLAIVKHIAEAHRGWAEAVPRECGALLRITLPAATTP